MNFIIYVVLFGYVLILKVFLFETWFATQNLKQQKGINVERIKITEYLYVILLLLVLLGCITIFVDDPEGGLHTYEYLFALAITFLYLFSSVHTITQLVESKIEYVRACHAPSISSIP